MSNFGGTGIKTENMFKPFGYHISIWQNIRFLALSVPNAAGGTMMSSSKSAHYLEEMLFGEWSSESLLIWSSRI